MLNTEKTFTDLVTALQAIAYATGQYTNDSTVDNIESISLSLFNISETLERIAVSLESSQPSIYQRHPGTDMTGTVQSYLDRK